MLTVWLCCVANTEPTKKNECLKFSINLKKTTEAMQYEPLLCGVIIMKKLTCYRTKDMENDIWCEDAFMFENGEDAEKFFTKERVAELYFEGDVTQVHSVENHGNWFAINGGGWDGIEIVEMSGGYYVNAT